MKTNTRNECALDFTDIYECLLEKHKGIFQIIKDGCKEAGFEYCDRVYIGSNFCSNYILHMKVEDYVDLKNTHLKVSFVLPITTQKNLAAVKNQFRQFQLLLGDYLDEIIINDYGMLDWCDKQTTLNIRLGRLFNKTLRDNRYLQLVNHYELTSYQQNLADTYRITGIELESIYPARKQRISPFDQIAKNIDIKKCISIIRPYSYMTVGQVCEYSSIGKRPEKKFTPNANCCRQCQHHIIQYKMNDDEDYIRLGRAILIPSLQLIPENTNRFRDVYFPLTMAYTI